MEEKQAASTVESILVFWFGNIELSRPLSVTAEPEARQRWFGGGEAFDREIDSRFGALLPALESSLRQNSGEAPSELLADSSAASLARILVLDQFSRNLHRGSAGMFATDDLAIRETLSGLDGGLEGELGEDARAFFLMPLMHSEDAEVQRRSVESFARLVQDCPASFRERAEGYLDYAEQHRVIVERFGRYPHRNELLGRPSTAEEEEFLQQPGSSF